MIEESFKDFAKLSWSLEDQLQTTKARTKVTEELTRTLKDQLRRILEEITWIEKELSLAKDHVAGMEAWLWKKKKTLSSKKASNANLKKKLSDVVNRVERA